jgi:hypothetical protein
MPRRRHQHTDIISGTLLVALLIDARGLNSG